MNRGEISEAVGPLGWRLVLGAVYTEVLVPSMADAAAAAAHSVHAAGADASGHLSIDIRSDRAVLRLRTHDAGAVTQRDLDLASEVSQALAARGFELTTAPGAIQAIEIAIDALDIGSVRPFWKAVTGYIDEPGNSDLNAGLVDPFGRGPAIWFQQMDSPRPGQLDASHPPRNRVHLDIDVTHEAAPGRVDAALAAGGTLVSDRVAPRFWVLADAEGNEACICTWQGRD
ncbi:VOC family protein [Mycobacterium sp. DL440]|uniref:VOC family protein n=1 Tax=Mycobacterium sp. DL440 TaxID=2675523 RepID=UPI001AAE9FF0|nr:VOC family protein [Mycobacterium sp. DL440]